MGPSEGKEIFHAAEAVCASPDVLVCTLIDGKITYVHRRLWPALVKLAGRLGKALLAKVWDEHTPSGAHRSRRMAFPAWVPADIMDEASRLSVPEAEHILSRWPVLLAARPPRRRRMLTESDGRRRRGRDEPPGGRGASPAPTVTGRPSVFVPRSCQLSGGFTVAAPLENAFELFSPLGETLWVPGWNPELLHPPGASWQRGLVFRTQEEGGEAVWVVTALDRDRHEVEYHRVEAGRYVARVSVRCRPAADRRTEVQVTYTFVGLSEPGNREIAAMSPRSYEEKMRRWQAWIERHLSSPGAPQA